MGPLRRHLFSISSDQDDTTGRAAAGRPVDLLPTGAAFVPPANSAPVGVTTTCTCASAPDDGHGRLHWPGCPLFGPPSTYDLETALPGGPFCVTCWWWKPTVGDQCEACAEDTEARS